jgi:hypothetical protein
MRSWARAGGGASESRRSRRGRRYRSAPEGRYERKPLTMPDHSQKTSPGSCSEGAEMRRTVSRTVMRHLRVPPKSGWRGSPRGGVGCPPATAPVIFTRVKPDGKASTARRRSLRGCRPGNPAGSVKPLSAYKPLQRSGCGEAPRLGVEKPERVAIRSRFWASTVGQRYTRSDALRREPSTTELEQLGG